MSKGNSLQDGEEILLVSIICAHRAEDHSWNLLPLFKKKKPTTFFFYAVFHRSESIQNLFCKNQYEMYIS